MPDGDKDLSTDQMLNILMNDLKNRDQKPKNIHQRLQDVMADVKYIKKEDASKKKGMEYNYVTHDAVTAAVRAAMVKHSIVAIPNVQEFSLDQFQANKWDPYNKKEKQVTVYLAKATLSVDFYCTDNPTDSIKTTGWFGMGLDSQDKAPGKAFSYAFKYCLLKTFMLETGDEDVEADQTTEYTRSDHPLDGVNIGKEMHQGFAEELYERIKSDLKSSENLDILKSVWSNNLKTFRNLPPDLKSDLEFVKDSRKQELSEQFDTDSELISSIATGQY